jgi:tetratricopeptide (TPR) repeat protein
MNKKILAAGGALLLAGGAVAYLVAPRREATTASAEAFAEYRAGQEDVQRIYTADARRHFEMAIEEDPHFVMALTRLALLQPEGSTPSARDLLARAAEGRDRVSRRERLALDLARALVADRTKDAEKIAKVLKDDYRDQLGYETYCRLLANDGKAREAEAGYREMLRYDPNYAIAYNSLGYSAAQRGDFEEAIADLKKYAFMAPGQANPFDSLGEVETACGRYDDAIGNLKHALAIKSDFYPSYQHLGQAYAGKGDYPAARDNYEKAYGMAVGTGEKVDIGLGLFVTALDHGDLATAGSVAERVSKLKLEHVPNPAPLLRAVILSEQGKDAEARAMLTELPACAPTEELKYRQTVERYVMSATARIDFNAGRYAEAIGLAEKVLAAPMPGNGLSDQTAAVRLRALEARARARLGDIAGAQALLASNGRRNPNDFLTRRAEQEVAELRRKP